MRKTIRLSPLAVCVLVSTAAAQQGGWLVETASPVSPAQPTTTVEVWAWFEDPGLQLAFAWGDFDFIASDGLFSNAQVHLPTFGAVPPSRSTPGTVVGNTVNGVFVGQVWGFLSYWANTQNPILAWSADWTTTDFTPRHVSLETAATTTFMIGDRFTLEPLVQLYPQAFTPGTGVIRVVPSPASATLLVLGAVMLRRRRPR